MSVHRLFVLRNDPAAQSLYAFLKSNWKALAEQGKPLSIECKPYKTTRTLEQNAFLHGPVLTQIAEQAWWGGKQYPVEFWKEYFRQRYLIKDEYTTPTGEMVNTYWSTADLEVEPFNEFVTKVQAEASAEWGVQFC